MILLDLDLSKRIRLEMMQADTFAITDTNVFDLYGNLFEGVPVFVIEAGEDSKTLDTVKAVCLKMLESGCNRKTRVIAVGGGVVGDIAGFTAAVFMRGVEWVGVPTTLLAQVDSSVGGKTGVDLEDYKNIIGAFHQPQRIFISQHFLKTLPERERICGLGEVIKTAFLHPPLYELVNDNLAKLIAFEDEYLQQAVNMCVEFKDSVVSADERETTGHRKILNLGHTVGHALEKADKHRLSHGEYVLWGMLYENYITKNFITMQCFINSEALLKKVLKGRSLKFDSCEVANAALFDKKNENGRISVISLLECGVTKELFFGVDELANRLAEAQTVYG